MKAKRLEDIHGNPLSIPTSTSMVFDKDGRSVNDLISELHEEIAMIKSVFPYTYIVNSDESLQAWAKNVEGNDYSHIIIYPGVYKCNTNGINLSETKTYTISGVVGGDPSVITFKNASRGLYYKNNDNIENMFYASPIVKAYNGKFFMSNFHVRIENVDVDYESVYGIAEATNITNVKVEIENTLNKKDQLIEGFFHCNSLLRCVAYLKDYNTSPNPENCLHCFSVSSSIIGAVCNVEINNGNPKFEEFHLCDKVIK